LKRFFPVYVNKLSPCYTKDHLGNAGCPAGNDIPRFLRLVALRRFEEAFYVLKETNPFSAGCGRFCDHPCETACNRGKFDEPVDIKALERFVADWGYKNNLKPEVPKTKIDKSVAVIGAGPAGLASAYFLAKNGYSVDIYEKASMAGGLLAYGIPEYRYPNDILEYELQYIYETGVNITLNHEIDKNRFLDLAEEYDSVIVATGAQSPGTLNLEGEDFPGVENGIEFLRKINEGNYKETDVKIGENIGVIGGGYTAFDVARVSCRLGAKPSVIYRRTFNEMTAHAGEIEDCEKEGVKFFLLRQPVKIEKVGDKLKLVCAKMKLGPVDESGRSKPIPVKDAYDEFYFDRIVLAVGDKPDLFFVGERFVNEYPNLNCPDLPNDLKGKIFIAGDASQGNSELVGMVVRAVGSAQITTNAVRQFLGETLNSDSNKDIAYFNTLNTKYFQESTRMVEEKIPLKERISGFREIVQTIDEDTAVIFAERCFFCGLCIQCDWCFHYSDGTILKYDKEWSPKVDECFYAFIKDNISDATFKSVEACPRSALSIAKEGSKLAERSLDQHVDINSEHDGGINE